MAKTIFQVINEKLDGQKENARDALLGGAAQDYAAYKELCGLIRGLETAQREVNDLAKKIMEEDDDD
jgi:hypothetical protein